MKKKLSDILEPFGSIAWDMDNTLVDNRHSLLYIDYINAHPEKRHFVVTFRGKAWAEMIPMELSDQGLRNPHETILKIVTCPEQTFANSQKQILTLEDVHDFITWKGKVCSELGCQVMVDDAESHVRPGCVEYGIVFVNAVEMAVR